MHGLDIEITSWSVRAATSAAPAAPVSGLDSVVTAHATGTRSLYDPATGGHVDAGLLPRADLKTGQHMAGPAVITERETTVIVPRGFAATMRADGCIELRRA